MGELFRNELRNKLNDKVVIEVRGRGLMNAIEINSSKQFFLTCYYFHNLLWINFADFAEAWNICLKLKENGLIAKHTHDDIIRLTPPLIINEAEIQEAVDIIVKSINSVTT